MGVVREWFTKLRYRPYFIRLSILLGVIVMLPIVYLVISDSWMKGTMSKQREEHPRFVQLQIHGQFIDLLLRNTERKAIQIVNRINWDSAINSEGLAASLQYEIKDFENSVCCVESIDVYYGNHVVEYNRNSGLQFKYLMDIYPKKLYSVLLAGRVNWFVEEKQGTNFITLLRPIPNVGNPVDGYLVIRMKPAQLLASPYGTRSDEHVWMGTPDGLHLFNTKNGQRLNNQAYSLAYSVIGSSKLDQTIVHWFDNDLFIKPAVSPVTGWKYLYAVDGEGLITRTEKTLRWVWQLIIGLIVLLGMYVLVSGGQMISTMRKLDERLVQQGRETAPVMLHHLFDKILYGDIEFNNKTVEKLASLGINLKGLGSFVLIIRIDAYSEFLRNYSSFDRSLFRFFITKMTQECLEPDYNLYIHQSAFRDIVVICEPRRIQSDYSADRSLILDHIRQLQDQLKQHLKISVITGVAGPSLHPNDMKQLHDLIVEKFESERLRYSGQVLSSWEDREVQTPGWEWTRQRLDIIRQISVAIRSKDTAMAESWVTKLEHYCIEYHAHAELIHNTYLELLVQSAHTACECGLAVSEEMQMLHLYDKIKQQRTLEELTSFAREMLNIWIMELKQQRYETGKNNVAQMILQYVQMNFNKDISLNGIADQLQYDPSMVSRLFKQEVGITFMEYLILLRIERAKQLLTTTKNSVQEIGNSVGYVNVHSFIRIFKKYVGSTPGQYREANRQDALDLNEIY